MTWMSIFLFAGLFLLVVALPGLVVVVMYNKLVGRRLGVENAWSQIEVQLKRRYDLIPNLVETVKGYASHERNTLEAVIKARQTAIDARSVHDKAEAENALTQTLRQLMVLQEAYPQLKANENFAALQEELTSTENKIGYARQFYNDIVSQYNAATQMFPSNLIAGLFGFKSRDFFSTDTPGERNAPNVRF